MILHKQWMRWLVRELRARGIEKAVLVLDSFKAHLEKASLKLAKEEGLLMVIIPGGLTGVLQPLDLRINAVFKFVLRRFYLLWLEKGGGPLDERNLVKMMGWQDLLTIIQLAWDEIPADLIQSSFRAAGLGLRLDGTEDDYVWSTASEYEKVLKTQREKTLDHEAKAAALGSASSAQKASKDQTKEQIEALSKRERRKARQQLEVAGLEDGEVVAAQEEEDVPDPEDDDALADAVNDRNGFQA